jgi:hypothetical protein
MYKIIKLHNRELNCNSKCKVCPSSFEFVDYISSESIVTEINQTNNGYKNIIFIKGNKECNICKYKIQL